MKFRGLRADEIECRIGTVSKEGTGLSLLLYKTARVDADILDETVGPESWQSEFYECKGTLFCKVGILADRGDGLAEWVWKSDAGAPSNMESEKGEASDAFKRACFKWGIGRELYTAPFIWIPAERCNIAGGRCFDRFDVAKVQVSEGEQKCLEGLRIVNAKTGEVVYSWLKQS